MTVLNDKTAMGVKHMNSQEDKAHESTLSLTEQPVTVLLIDDQPMIGETVRRLLATEEDIIFHYCSEPTQAIQMATEIAPTVILQDLIMPEIDGLLLVRFFRANAITRHIPIIVLSTKEDPKLKAEAFTCNANDYLVKLPDKVELLARIRYHSKAYTNFIKQSRLQAQVEAQVKILSEQSQQLKATITELQTTQSQLIQAEKMASLGQLIAGVVHAINNPINFIYGNLTYVDEYTQALVGIVKLYQQECPHPSPKVQEQIEDMDLSFLIQDLPKMLSSMRVGADRICQIVSGLRNFSRIDESEIKSVNIHEGLESTLLILQHRLKTKSDHLGIQIVKEYGELPPVECYAGQLNQVFINIFSHIIDMLNEYDKERSAENLRKHPNVITICTEVIMSQWSEVSCPEQQIPEKVAIRIRDNGPGMTPDVKERIFNPFFTPQNPGKDTGLGLAISHHIVVEKHHGMLKCFSELDQGTEFVIEVPIKQGR